MTNKLLRKTGADLPDPSPSVEANSASVVQLHAQGNISEAASRKVLDLDPVDLSRRRALAVADAVRAEVLIAQAMCLAAEELIALQAAKEQAEDKAAALKIEVELGKVTMRVQRDVTAYSTLRVINDRSIDELRAFAEKSTGIDSTKAMNLLVEQYLDAQKRQSINLGELKRQAVASDI